MQSLDWPFPLNPCLRLWRLVQAKGLLGEQDSQGKRGEENDYLASNMKFDEQEHEQLMLEAQNMDKVLRGEQVSPQSSSSSPRVLPLGLTQAIGTASNTALPLRTLLSHNLNGGDKDVKSCRGMTVST